MNLKPRLVFTIAASLAWAASLLGAGSAKEPFSSAEAAKLVGQPVIHAQTLGPVKDDDSPSQGTHWTYHTKDIGVIVSRMEFASAAEAKKYATVESIKKMDDGDDTKITPDSGVGEKTFWIVGEGSCGLIFLKGSTIASISIAGKIGSPESHKAALKAAATDISARL